MRLDQYGMQLITKGAAIEKVASRKMDISLLASYDGTEIIHHRLDSGA